MVHSAAIIFNFITKWSN